MESTEELFNKFYPGVDIISNYKAILSYSIGKNWLPYMSRRDGVWIYSSLYYFLPPVMVNILESNEIYFIDLRRAVEFDRKVWKVNIITLFATSLILFLFYNFILFLVSSILIVIFTMSIVEIFRKEGLRGGGGIFIIKKEWINEKVENSNRGYFPPYSKAIFDPKSNDLTFLNRDNPTKFEFVLIKEKNINTLLSVILQYVVIDIAIILAFVLVIIIMKFSTLSF